MPQNTSKAPEPLEARFAAMSDQDLKAEADRLYKQAERENLGSFTRTEKSRETYDKYLVARRELDRRQTLAELEAAEKERVRKEQARLSEILKRRPANPTVSDIDALKSADMGYGTVLVAYAAGHRLLDSPYEITTKSGNKTGRIRHQYLLQTFDPEEWIWRRENTQAAQRAPKAEFKRVVVEEPVDQAEIDFWGKEFKKRAEKYLGPSFAALKPEAARRPLAGMAP